MCAMRMDTDGWIRMDGMCVCIRRTLCVCEQAGCKPRATGSEAANRQALRVQRLFSRDCPAERVPQLARTCKNLQLFYFIFGKVL
jgi:hypothetical protein